MKLIVVLLAIAIAPAATLAEEIPVAQLGPPSREGMSYQCQSKTLYAFESDMFERCDGLTLSLAEPTPDPANPIIKPGKSGQPDSGMIQGLCGILPWRDGFGLWYMGRDLENKASLCFASSKDGLSWQKHGPVEGFDGVSMIEPTVFHDGQRYIAFFNDAEGLRPEHATSEKHRQWIEQSMAHTGQRGVPTWTGAASSDDGLTWRATVFDEPMIRAKIEVPRGVMFFQGRYVANAQTTGPWAGPGGRCVVFFTSADLKEWNQLPHVFQNPQGGPQTHVGIAPIKRIDDRLLIGLGGRFDDAREIRQQRFEITLLYSYDGVKWRSVAEQLGHRDWIRRGRAGQWDFGGVKQGDGSLIEVGDDAYIYYMGSQRGNLPSAWLSGSGAIGRVTLKRDRFAGLQPTIGWKLYGQLTPQSGQLLTKPLTLSTHHGLALNIEGPEIANQNAAVAVEVRDAETGNVIARGETRQSGVCVPVTFDQPVTARSIQLAIRVAGGPTPDTVPVLYAIYF